MCFSAAASFTVGSVLLITGVGSLALIPVRAPPTMTRKQQAALATVAAIPLIFGLHQISEGMVWLDFENDVAVQCFAFTAYAFWPLYISLAFALVEWTRNETAVASRSPDNDDRHHHYWSNWPYNVSVTSRRRLLLFHVLLAVALDSYILANMVPLDNDGVIDVNGRLQYEGWGIEGQTAAYSASVVYAYVVVASMYFSSLPYSSLLGGLMLASLGLTLILWTQQYPSTWCFFASVLSCIVALIVWSELQMNRRDQGQSQQETDARQSKAGSMANDGPSELQEQPSV